MCTRVSMPHFYLLLLLLMALFRPTLGRVLFLSLSIIIMLLIHYIQKPRSSENTQHNYYRGRIASPRSKFKPWLPDREPVPLLIDTPALRLDANKALKKSDPN